MIHKLNENFHVTAFPRASPEGSDKENCFAPREMSSLPRLRFIRPSAAVTDTEPSSRFRINAHGADTESFPMDVFTWVPAS